MSDSTLRKFVNRLSFKKQEVTVERVFVGAFGKHPGWDDHIDDIGFGTDSFVAAKRLLYVQGIGGNIDSGAWDKVAAENLVEGFRHVLVWCMEGSIIVGRMWSSRDGKGRSSYPMVVCVQCRRLPVRWIVESILPRLEIVEQRCVAVGSAGEVRAIIEDAQREFRGLARAFEDTAESPVVYADSLARLSEIPEMGPQGEGLLRILYHIDREAGRFHGETAGGAALRPVLLRVPGFGSAMTEGVLTWISFLLSRFGVSMPVLVLVPLGQSWADIIMGEPTEVQLRCLRVSLGVIPLTSSIPYNMGSEFVDQVSKLIEDSRSGGAEADSRTKTWI
ncbi:MAG: hypothetical protein JSU94_09100 [Phycisphaerales bacterium]|nr:MAG: hypothetical protein JSU94_09100 [Phycisphaerales bacterium]